MEINNAVLNTIQSMTNQIFTSIDNSLIGVLDKLVYIDESLLRESLLFIFTKKIEITMRIMAESILFGYILYYLIRYLISRITSYNRDDLENPGIFFIKVVFIGIAIFYSNNISKILVELNNNISIDFGNNMFPAGKLPTFSSFLKTVNNTFLLDEESVNIFSIDGIFKGFVSFGTLNMTVTFALRYVLVKVLIIMAPIAFVTKVFTKTEKIFNMWFKTLISLLLVQHFITLILVLGGFLKANDYSTMNKIAYIGIIYALSKSFYLFEKIFGAIAPDVQVSFPFK